MSNEVLATQVKLTALARKVSEDELQLQQLNDAKQAAVTGEYRIFRGYPRTWLSS